MKKHKYKCETLIKCREGHVACKADMIAPGLYIFPEMTPSDGPRLEQTTRNLATTVKEYGEVLHHFLVGDKIVDVTELEKKYRAIFNAIGLKPPKPLCGNKRK